MDGPRQRCGEDNYPLKSGDIEVDNASFVYRDDNLVPQNISPSVPPHDFVALVRYIGNSEGALANPLVECYPLTQEEICLDGHPLSSPSHGASRQGIAVVQ